MGVGGKKKIAPPYLIQNRRNNLIVRNYGMYKILCRICKIETTAVSPRSSPTYVQMHPKIEDWDTKKHSIYLALP